ncbi:MAG: NUDIX hydrolase, partial [Maribacter sp.]
MEDVKIENFIHHLSFDCVIFGFNGTVLKILILEYHDTEYFALPGGFIRMDQSLEQAVQQGVKE